MPFGTSFTIDKPVVASLSTCCTLVGDRFTINGSGFYPAPVTAVPIDGTPLEASQYEVASPQAITVTAPFSGVLTPVEVRTTQGSSNDDSTISVGP